MTKVEIQIVFERFTQCENEFSTSSGKLLYWYKLKFLQGIFLVENSEKKKGKSTRYLNLLIILLKSSSD